MKKITTTVLVCVIGLLSLSTSVAQTLSKGSIIGNGTFDFFSGKEKQEFGSSSSFEDKITSFGFTPWAGYFITTNLGVGAGLNFSLSSAKDDSGDNTFSETQITFGPVVRYYITEGPFVQGYFGFGSQKTKITSGGVDLPEAKESVTEWQAGVGYSIRLSDTVLLDPLLGYGSSVHENKDADNKVTVSGFFIRVGFTIILIAP